MQEFYESYGFILSFMVACLVLQMTLGNKFLEGFLWLVLLSMVVLNAEKFTKFLNGGR